MKKSKVVVAVKNRTEAIDVKDDDLKSGYFMKKLELWMKEIKNSVIKARIFIAGFSMLYNSGGRKYIREIINDALRYFTSSYEDTLKMGYNLIEDFFKSPELIPALRILKKLQHEFKHIIEDDKLFLDNCKEIEEIMLDDPRKRKTVVINGYTIPANAHHCWNLRKEDGTLKSKKELEEDFEAFLVYSEKAHQKKITSFERDKEIRRFETELAKADGNISVAYQRMFSSKV
jgi:hypothetical protein